MKILITGATGFIGNHVVHRLLSEGKYDIICTSLNHNKAKSKSWYKQVTYIECDLSKKNDNYFKFFNSPDLMIHLAWYGLPNYNESFHMEKNYPADCLFIKNMLENGLKNIAISGTCFEYGMMEGSLKEELPTNPVTVYGKAKNSLREYLEKLRQDYNFHYNWIRLFYMYGKGQSPKSILEQLKKSAQNQESHFKMSGGEQLRDYLPVTDVANYIVKIAIQEKYQGIINCCSGKPISIRKLVENYIKENNYKIELNLGFYPYLNYEPMAFWGDNSRLNKI